MRQKGGSTKVEHFMFDYKRRIKRNNSVKEQIIKCKIKGLRSEALKNHLERKMSGSLDSFKVKAKRLLLM